MSADLERKLRRQFLNDLSQMNDAALAEYLATPEGQHIAALLQYYAAHHPSSTSNQTANGILDRVPDRGAQHRTAAAKRPGSQVSGCAVPRGAAGARPPPIRRRETREQRREQHDGPLKA